MKEPKEVIKKVNEVEEKSVGVAAFFDLDGTLAPLPSLERRFFRTLLYQRAINAKNYFSWMKEAVRLMPRGISTVLQANKMYLRGVQSSDKRDDGDGDVRSRHKDGHQAKGQASTPLFRIPRLPVPTFFAHAIERVVWHARQGHEIVLVSGTLEPLALGAARAVEVELAARGITAPIRVRATRLEEMDGQWTGRILGEAMFGAAKARAAKRFAEERRLDLARCYAYGDSMNDRWLLEAVGKGVAVNSSNELAQLAQTRGWPAFQWDEGRVLTPRSQSTQSSRRGTLSLARGVDREIAKQMSFGDPQVQLMNGDAIDEAAYRGPR